MKRLAPYLILSLIVIVGYTLVFVQVDSRSVEKLETSFNEQQVIHVDLAARAIEDHYDWQLTILGAMGNVLRSGHAITSKWDEVVTLFESQSDNYHEYPLIGLLDPSGDLLETESFALSDESITINLLQSHAQDALAHEALYVSPILATQSYQYYVIYHPIIQRDVIVGYFGLVVDFAHILERHIAPIRSGTYGAAWIQDHHGTVIYDHETEIIGQSVYDLHANHPALRELDERYLYDNRGIGEYTFTVERNGEERRKLLAWNTASLGNQHLTIAMSAPDSEVSSLLSESRRVALLSGITLFTCLMVGGLWIGSIQQQQLRIQVAERTEELQNEQRLLKENERILHLSLEAAHADVWALDINPTCIRQSDASTSIGKLEQTTYDGNYREWCKLVYPEDLPQLDAAIRSIKDGGGTQFNEEYRVYDPDGHIRHFLGRGIVLFDEANEPKQLVGINIDITERKLAEEGLQSSKLMYQSLVDSLPMNIYRTDLDGRITFVNRWYLDELGIDESDIIGNTAYDFYPEALANKYRDDDAETIKRDEIFHTVEENIDLTTNTSRHVEVIKIPIHDESGKIIGIQGAFWDVSERIENARQLERYSNQLETVQEIASLLSSTLNLDEVLHLFLKEVEKLVPYDSASIFLDQGNTTHYVAGRYLPDFDNPAELAARIYQTQAYQQVKATHQPLRFGNVALEPNWTEFDFASEIRSWMGIPLVYKDQFLGLLGIDHHVPDFFDEESVQIATAVAHQAASAIANAQFYTDLERRVELRTRELRETEANERALLEAIPDAVFRLHRDGTVLDCRIQPHEKFYADPQTLIGHRIKDVFTPETAAITLDKLEATLQSQTMQTYNYLLELEDISPIYLEARMVAISDSEAVVLVRDVSKDQQLKEQRERFIANAAHELKTPLTIFMTHVYLLRKRPDKLEQHIDVLEAVSQRMKTLIQELLDIARFESGALQLNLSTCRPDELVKSVVEQLAASATERGLELVMESPEPTIPMILDEIRMGQVVTNLVINAINYTDNGMVRIRVFQDSEFTNIAIEDTGAGIPEKYLPDEIFLPFNRAHRQSTVKGTGLGLAIAKEIVEQHNGTIVVTSEIGKGSTFIIQLPMS